MKAMKSEIKEKVQETNSDRKETGTQINGLEKKEEINIQPEQNEETRIQKKFFEMKNFISNEMRMFQHTNHRVPEGED